MARARIKSPSPGVQTSELNSEAYNYVSVVAQALARGDILLAVLILGEI